MANVVVVVVVLFYVHGKQLRSCRDGQLSLTTLFLGRLRPPKRLTSTSCTYFRQYLTTALLESEEGETKVCGQTRYQTQDLWLTSKIPYRLRYAARRHAKWTIIVRATEILLNVSMYFYALTRDSLRRGHFWPWGLYLVKDYRVYQKHGLFLKMLYIKDLGMGVGVGGIFEQTS